MLVEVALTVVRADRALARLDDPSPGRSGVTTATRPVRTRLRAYVALTKPRIIELLLVTTVPVMFLAAGGAAPAGLVTATVIGGALAAGSANTLNCVLDRDIDQTMRRTRRRPLPRHQVGTRAATAFGLLLGVGAVSWLWLLVNPLSALLALSAIVFYVVGYTMLLKRRTPQNIVWGGAAGCVPVLVGWAAVRGTLDWTPVLLFLVVFWWTPPHFWSLALRYRADYAAAEVPMLPVVAPAGAVATRILGYAWATVITSLLVWPVAGTGWLYPVAAAVLGAGFLVEAHLLRVRTRTPAGPGTPSPMRLFHVSNAYLALLFVAVALDPLLR